MAKLDELDENQNVKKVFAKTAAPEKPVKIAKPGEGPNKSFVSVREKQVRENLAARNPVREKIGSENFAENAEKTENAPENFAKTEKNSRKFAKKPEIHAEKISHHKKTRLSASKNRKILAKKRVVGYGLRNFTRNTWLTVAATVVMTITLLIVFATLVASLVLNETITAQRAKMDYSVYIKKNVSADTLNNLAGKLRVQPNVANVETSSSDEQYEIARQKAVDENNQAWLDGATIAAQNGTPVQFPALITLKFRDPNEINGVKDFIASDPQFKEWVDSTQNSADSTKIQQTTVNRLSDVMNSVQRFGFAAVLLFVVISILIVFNTIRMAIFSRREEIDMMKAIGADRSFIRGPFLVEAELYGVIAAGVALAIGYFAISRILPALGNYFTTTDTQKFMSTWNFAIVFAMLIIGFLIGGLSARLAVRRYLKP